MWPLLESLRLPNAVLLLPACMWPLLQHLPTYSAPASRNDVVLMLPACRWLQPGCDLCTVHVRLASKSFTMI
jgi:hypothetical protein